MTGSADESHEATYAVLTDETRLAIILTLTAQYGEAWSSEWPSFSELRAQVGVDDTSRFSYHLTELQDEFVTKVDGRYQPRVAALEIAAGIRAGTYEEEPVSVDGRETAYGCPHCSNTLTASYSDHRLYVGCPDHGAAVAYPTPPRALQDRRLQDVIEISLRKHACDVRLLRSGVCPHCWGTAGLSVPRGSVPESYLLDDVPYATASCDVCWLSYPLPVARTVLGHAAVETLYADHDLGPAAAQLGPHDLARTSDVSLPDATPPSARVTTEIGDDELTVELDDGCQVLDSWRR